jgi:hypothetical protein
MVSTAAATAAAARERCSAGRQLGIAGANSGYFYLRLFYQNNQLGQIEGTAFSVGNGRNLTRCAFSSRLISPKQEPPWQKETC